MLTSYPCSRSGTTTIKMISSTSTTSTSGVMLMAACILAGSPSRIGVFLLVDDRHLAVRPHDLRYLEQAVHELRRSPIHLDVEGLHHSREVIEGDHGRDCHEDAQGGSDKGLGDTAGDDRHPAGPRGRDVPESVDDSGHGAEEPNERSRGTDRRQKPETLPQLDQRLGHGVSECAGHELK